VEDISNSTLDFCPERFSGSVLTEIQLRSLLIEFENSQGWWIALPGTHTPGDTAIPQLNLSVWHPSIRETIRRRLVQMGGVPLESPLLIAVDKEGKLSVRQATNLPPDSVATSAELVMDVDAPA